MTTEQLVRSYYQSWTDGRFDKALNLLSNTLTVEVPINSYPTRESFMAAVEFTSTLMENSTLVACFAEGEKAMILYDMQLKAFGKLRVAEYYRVKDGQIAEICQIHDTAPFRS